jgi:hypothetical protein
METSTMLVTVTLVLIIVAAALWIEKNFEPPWRRKR